MDNNKLFSRISDELEVKFEQVKETVNLLDDGNTIPFIARYRKEVTGGLDETQLRDIEERLEYLRGLEQRKEEVIRLIDEQDKLTDELEQKIKTAGILQEVEDLYRPYKQKRQTRATKAREKGLEPLAELIWEQEIATGAIKQYGEQYIDQDKGLETIDDVYQGARDIIAELISDDANIRKKVRSISFEKGLVVSSCKDKALDENNKYEIYYDYKEAVNSLPPHRILAINRGEAEEIIQVKVDVPEEEIVDYISKKVISNKDTLFIDQILTALKDGYKRLIAPSIEREIRNKLTEKAEEHAIEVFSRNLKPKLLQPPLKGKVIMGIDPGFRTGSKVCVIDQTGKLLATKTIYPHPPQNQINKAKDEVIKLVKQFNLNSIAIGNGTASRETESFIADIISDIKEMDKEKKLNYAIVDEAGASVYSASKTAIEEFPELDVSMRGAVSIARRLQDPLAELVKIEPKSIGVGLYQHDVNQKRLDESLADVVESAVNYVGVDLNTASNSLLEYVAGINSGVARNIISYREEKGSFATREELKNVYRLGAKTYKQAAGFLRITDGEDPLAATPIHPESYPQTRQLLHELDFTVNDIQDKEILKEIRNCLNKLNIKEKAEELQIGVPTLDDIITALKQPGRDPRAELSKPIFRTDVLKFEDLKADMILQGTVRNVVDFGAFVDIGVKEDGLVHISEMSYDYVKDPLNVVKVGDTIKVKILEVDERRKRISLTMKL
ncbi:MAG: Tex family protein [Halothermotrichaceae bacterium]